MKKSAAISTILSYHEETKHHFHRYARSAGYMDWDNQPDPFRRYNGAEMMRFPLDLPRISVSYEGLFDKTACYNTPLTVESLGRFLELSLGLSAWKSYAGSKWALRMNPSSGNLHPTEAHFILPEVGSNNQQKDIPSGVYHYNPLYHGLEKRAVISSNLSADLFNNLNKKGFLLCLCSIFWREAWKYGERAFRYCMLDAGHALASIRFAANLMGWRALVMKGVSDETAGRMLGFHKTAWVEGEAEHPDMMVHVFPAEENDMHETIHHIPNEISDATAKLMFTGKPAPLSWRKVNWDIIDGVAEATAKQDEKPVSLLSASISAQSHFRPAKSQFTAEDVIRKRRSAQAFTPVETMPLSVFLSILEKTLPKSNRPPFDADMGFHRAHLLIFVHRVDGITPGLFFLCRDMGAIEDIQREMTAPFDWIAVSEDMPLYLLKKGDYTSIAQRVSCNQEIAGNSVFSLGMVIMFRGPIEQSPHEYRRLHVECGMTGQVLYLSAEAYGYSGTGIGCFFDDAVHDLLGLKSNTFQTLYHFTIGKPVIDRRLTTLNAYHHLNSQGA